MACSEPDDRRSAVERSRRLALQATSLAKLPRPVARFWWRALRRAQAERDTWSIDVAFRPAELRVLLDALGGAHRVAEVGTAAGWTTSCIALAQPGREVDSWDVEAHPERDRYLALLSPADRARVRLHDRPGGLGPANPPQVDAVFIDSSHELEGPSRRSARGSRPCRQAGSSRFTTTPTTPTPA